eukprot:m.33371 g.33371  ORF g.33371 m.33371 type:complete len:1577 (-) comp5097_c0_seq1:1134-5864(-)
MARTSQNVDALIKKIPASLGELVKVSAVHDNIDVLIRCGILEVLPVALQSEHADILEKALTILKHISKYDPLLDADDSQAHAVFSSTPLPTILALLGHKSAAVAAQAALVVAAMANLSDDRSDVLIEHGILMSLLSMLGHTKTDVQIAAALALASFCTGRDQERVSARATQLFRLGLIPKFTRMLDLKSVEMREAAARALLCAALVEEAREVSYPEIIPSLLRVFSGASDSEVQLKITIVSTLLVFVQASPISLNAFASFGGFSAVAQAMVRKKVTPQLMASCAGLLQSAASSQMGVKDLTGNTKLFQKVLNLLLQPIESLRQTIMNFLVAIATQEDEMRLELVKAGTIQFVARMLFSAGVREDLLLAGLKLLELLASPRLYSSNKVDLSKIVASSELVPSLMVLLSANTTVDILKHAVCVLRNICCVSDESIRDAIANSEALRLLLNIVHGDQLAVVSPAIEALGYLWDAGTVGNEIIEEARSEIAHVVLPLAKTLLEYEEVSAACARLLECMGKHSDAYANAVVSQADLLKTLVLLLGCESESVVYAVAGALIEIGAQSNTRRAAIYEAGGGPKVALILAHPSDRCRMRAAVCLAVLCTGGETSAGLRHRLVERNIFASMAEPLGEVEGDYTAHVSLFFWVLIREGGDYQKAAVAAGAIPLLTRYLQSANMVANWRSAKALAILLGDYSCLYGIISAGSVAAVVSLLSSPHGDVQRAAIDCVQNLSFSNHIEAAEDAGVVQELTALLIHPNFDTRIAAINALGAIRTQANSLKINSAILSMMHSWQDRKLVTAAAECLLSSDPQAIQPGLLQAAAKKLLDIVMSTPSERRSLIKLIAQCIDSSAKSDAFMAAGLIPYLPALLKSNDNLTKIWTSIAVRNIVVDSETRLKAVIDAGVGPLLHAMMLTDDLHCQLAGLFTIPPLLATGLNIVDVLGQVKAIENIVNLLQSTVSEILVGACQTIQIMANNADTRKALVAQKCTSALIRLFSSGVVSVVCEAALALATLASSNDATSAQAMIEEGAVPALIEALKAKSNKKVTCSTAFALTALAEKSDVAGNAVVDSGALSILDSMMENASYGMQEAGVDMLGSLFHNRDAENRARTLLARNSMAKVLRLLKSSSAEVRNVVALTMWHASKTEVGAVSLTSSLPIFLDLLKRFPSDTTLQPILVQIFANLLRFGGDRVRESLVAAADVVQPLVAVVQGTLTAKSDVGITLDCLTVSMNVNDLYVAACSANDLDTVAILAEKLCGNDLKEDVDAASILSIILQLSYCHANRRAIAGSSLVPILDRFLEFNNERLSTLVLRTLTNLCFSCNLLELLPDFADRLASIKSPLENVVYASVLHYALVPRERRNSATSLAATMNKRVAVVFADQSRELGLRLRDMLQQSGSHVITPNVSGAITPALLKELRQAVDMCGAFVVCADPELLGMEGARIMMCMAAGDPTRIVVPVRASKTFQPQTWQAALAVAGISPCFEEQNFTIAFDALRTILAGKPVTAFAGRKASLAASSKSAGTNSASSASQRSRESAPRTDGQASQRSRDSPGPQRAPSPGPSKASSPGLPRDSRPAISVP